jgi:SAM-dependent methyltransferase
LCSVTVDRGIRNHILSTHGREAWHAAVVAAKEQGLPDPEIGTRFYISFNTLQEIITEAYGVNVSVLKGRKKIRSWEPPGFHEEATTVWSFKRRGDWATHDGRYRGNWSPYIPRNLILKYSKPGETVLDFFVGGGTTAVEAKLLRRRCIARDINPVAVGLTKENTSFVVPQTLLDQPGPVLEPDVTVGDARRLAGIEDNSVDLICAHPPYAGIIKFCSKIDGDLAHMSVQEFLANMAKVAEESWRVLKPGRNCAILIGDARKSKCVVPIGFETIRVFLDAGFILRDLVIKRQHNCKTTGFWYAKSLEHNFLLLAHEYLPIFEKPKSGRKTRLAETSKAGLPYRVEVRGEPLAAEGQSETTSVWILPADRIEDEILRNLVNRFAIREKQIRTVEICDGDGFGKLDAVIDKSAIYVTMRSGLETLDTINAYRSTVKSIAAQASEYLPEAGCLIIEAKDVRVRGQLQPLGFLVWKDMRELPQLAVKEIVIVLPDEVNRGLLTKGGPLEIVHRYLLVYTKRGKTG